MQLVVKNGEVVADHPDSETVSAAAYGEGALIVTYTGAVADLPKIGPAPAPGEPDLRPRQAPPFDAKAYAAAVRYDVETGGVTVGGARITTDEASQAKIGNAYQLLQATGAASVQYKAETGFVTLTSDAFKALAIAVGQHVQACFAKESDVDAAITAGTITTAAEIDAAFAPLRG